MESECLQFIKYSCSLPVEKLSSEQSPADWQKLYEFARKHSVLGLTFAYIDSLEAADRPPLKQYAIWALNAEKIKQQNELFNQRSAQLYDYFRKDGFRSCILKGQGTAAFYPDPTLRQCGDIDIWVDSDLKSLLGFFRKKNLDCSNIVYHNCGLKIFDDAEVEVHYHPSFMNSPRLNRRLQRYFKSVSDEQFANYFPEKGFCAPDAVFSAVYGLVHIFRHLFFEGIGLRQIVDLYYILKALPATEKARVMEVMDTLSLRRFTSAVMWVLGTALGLEEKYILCNPSARYGSLLLHEILRSGNFGTSDPLYSKIHSGTLPQRAYYKITRVFRYIGICPEEVLFTPVFKTWQFIWRKINKFN